MIVIYVFTVPYCKLCANKDTYIHITGNVAALFYSLLDVTLNITKKFCISDDPLCGKSTGDQWMSLIQHRLSGKPFHTMKWKISDKLTSSRLYDTAIAVQLHVTIIHQRLLCAIDISRSFSLKKSQKTPHSSPERMSYGMSFVSTKFDWCFATVIVGLCA